MPLDPFVLSNVAAISKRHGLMQRETETHRSKHTENSGKRGNANGETFFNGQIRTSHDVVSLSQIARDVRQAGINCSAFLSLAKGNMGSTTRETEPDLFHYLGGPDSKVDRLQRMRRAFLAYGKGSISEIRQTSPWHGQDGQTEGVDPEKKYEAMPAISIHV